MGFSKRLNLDLFLSFLIVSGVVSSQLYLTPSEREQGYFTGDNFFITCYTSDPKIDKLKWVDADQNEIKSGDRIKVQRAQGAQQGLELVFDNVHDGDSGKYVCTDDEISIEFELFVYRAISFVGTDAHQKSPEDRENAMLTCIAKAHPSPKMKWSYKGKTLSSGAKYTVNPDSLVIHHVTREDAGLYTCTAVVIAHRGTQYKETQINFHVQYKPEWIEGMQTVFYVTKGAVANLVCSASADPEPEYTWTFQGEPVYNSSDHMIFNNASSSVLQLTLHDESQLGKYVCQAYNIMGTNENILELKEGKPPTPPHLGIQKEGDGEIFFEIHSSPKSELNVTGFKLEFVLKNEKWDQASFQEFNVGEPFVLRNVTYGAVYMFRAYARNAVGYGEHSEEVSFQTKVPPKAEMVNSGSGMLPSAAVIVLGLFSYFQFCDMSMFSFSKNLI